ncbi:hypothetical protein [Polaromonas sp. C04]|nr:hypothetical protein [Polaromonas sp. C04]
MDDSANGSALKAVVIVLAVIGAIAVLGVFGMAVIHSGMLGRIGAC